MESVGTAKVECQARRMGPHPCQKALKPVVGIQGMKFSKFRLNLITTLIFLTLLSRKFSNNEGLESVSYPQAAGLKAVPEF